MSDNPSHKRSKSALALSILHRDKSKASDNKEDDVPTSENGSPTSTTASSPTHSSSNHYMSGLRSGRRKAGPDATPRETALEHSISNQDKGGDAVNKRLSPGLSSDTTGNMSIEQSVRTFRLFEVLRGGDTTAISKAIKESQEEQSSGALGTTILHLAIQCAEHQVVEYVLGTGGDAEINSRDREGNTPLHLAAQLGRSSIVRELIERPSINDSAANFQGQTPLDLARTPEIFQQLQLARSLFIDSKTREIQGLIAEGDYEGLEKVLVEPRVESILDVNSLDLVTDRTTAMSGGTLLHEGARKKDTRLIQSILMHGADPFIRDRKGKLPQDVTKDDRTKAILKKSPAAAIAQRGVQEKAILGNQTSQGNPGRVNPGEVSLAGRDSREMKGYLKKWTNYTSGYKLRWFVLEDGVLSYYKHQGIFSFYRISLFYFRPRLTENSR